jgi:hypothetical protein
LSSDCLGLWDVIESTQIFGGRGQTYGSWCDIEITRPYHGFLLVEVTDIGFKMVIP